MTAVSVLSIPDPYSDNSNKVIYKRHCVLQAVDEWLAWQFPSLAGFVDVCSASRSQN